MNSAQSRFEAIVRALSGDLYRHALMLCRDHAQAEDLVQETFMRAWRSLDKLRDESKTRAYLITTLRREHARLYARFKPLFDDVDMDQLQSDLPAANSDQMAWAVREAVTSLSEKHREVVLLQLIWGYSSAEIAQLLDLAPATVHARLSRARQQLRQRVDAATDHTSKGAAEA